MKIRNALVQTAALTAMTCGSAMAATTIVNSGAGTLQQAIVAAADGDTLVLGTGPYTDADGIIYVDKSLTIRSESAAVAPLIYADIQQQYSVAFDYLRLQGLTFLYDSSTGYGGVVINGTVATVELLENNFSGYTDIDVNPTNTTANVTMVGNTIQCHSSWGGVAHSIYGNKINMLGNSMCTSYLYLYPEDTGAEANVIGNAISVEGGTVYVGASSGEKVLVAGNRITKMFTSASGAPFALGSGTIYEILRLGSSSYATVRNNIIKYSDARLDGVSVAKRFSPIADINGYTIENNLFEASSIGIWQPSIGETDQDAMFEEDTLQVPALFRNNIVVNYNDKVLPAGYDIKPEFNLCFNNSESGTPTNCGTANGNLDSDPLFVDTANYELQATSPAIDAGTTDLLLSDLDTSRNDMGPYGGNWSVAKFDAQRDAAETRPYIYPVIDSAYTVGGGTVKVKYVSYGRQQ